MDLKEIVSIAAVSNGLIRTTVDWDKPNIREEEQPDGSVKRIKEKPTRYSFDVHIVRELSYGATERILRAAGNPNVIVGAVIVSEAVRFGDNGTEKLDYTTAANMHPGLIMVLRNAVDKYHKGFGQTAADEAEGENPKKLN